jgi:hypothetical protein
VLQCVAATAVSVRYLYIVCHVTTTVFGFPQTIAKLRTVRLGAHTEAQFIIHFSVSRRITFRNLRLSPLTTIVVINNCVIVLQLSSTSYVVFSSS